MLSGEVVDDWGKYSEEGDGVTESVESNIPTRGLSGIAGAITPFSTPSSKSKSKGEKGVKSSELREAREHILMVWGVDGRSLLVSLIGKSNSSSLLGTGVRGISSVRSKMSAGIDMRGGGRSADGVQIAKMLLGVTGVGSVSSCSGRRPVPRNPVVSAAFARAALARSAKSSSVLSSIVGVEQSSIRIGGGGGGRIGRARLALVEWKVGSSCALGP